ncbi:hypothetical protein WKK05_12975 [Nostoc sp. UHCC 0302]|uniref:hypothetical protein n=1 Tax=Nostoc sp. UHCC 0302 TaxID=3134896 RepID=UPI00311CA232
MEEVISCGISSKDNHIILSVKRIRFWHWRSDRLCNICNSTPTSPLPLPPGVLRTRALQQEQ